MEGFFDEENSRFIPGNSVESEYELEPHECEAVDTIRRKIEESSFRSRGEILESVEMLENINVKIEQALRQETKAGNSNWTLKIRQEELVGMFKTLREAYLRHEG